MLCILVTVNSILLQQLPNVARVHEPLDAQQLGRVYEREQELGPDRGLAAVHEGQQVLHHRVAQVGDEDDGVSAPAARPRPRTPRAATPHKQGPEVGGAGGQDQPVRLQRRCYLLL